MLTINMISKKYSVQAEPQVIVASGAQPTSVILNWIPVFSTNFASDAEKAVFSIPMMAPIPVRAMASLIPPSSALENFTPKSRANTVKMINMMTGPPISKIGVKNSLIRPKIASITVPPFLCYMNVNKLIISLIRVL